MLNRVRQLKKESTGAKAAGFTIIEVMIVLAIAGIIMAIVFLAIPTLQRNNRNTQRKNDSSRISGLISDYVANNNGSLPTRLHFTGAVAVGDLDLSGEKFSILNTATMANVTPLVCTAALCGTDAAPLLPTAANPVPPQDTLKFVSNGDCGKGKNSPVFNASKRSYAIWFGIEGSTITQCISS